MAQFTNQATLQYNGITTTSNIVTGEITQIINIWKDATVDTYQSGDIITYVISLQNSGTVDFTGLTLSDNLGAYTYGSQTLVPLTFTGDPILYYINGILQPSPTIVPGPPLVINNISILAGTSTTLVYRTALNSYAPLNVGSQITNTVTLCSKSLTNPITASETISINNTPKLSILKTINPTIIEENGEVTYTFVIQNTGTSIADTTSGIVLNDTFSPKLKNISVYLNGNLWPTTGNYTYNAATGQFKTIAGQIIVPAATFTQDPTTGIWSMIPGKQIIEITGTI